MSDQPTRANSLPPEKPHPKPDPAQTTDLPAADSVGPDETTDIPVSATGAERDTARRADTSVPPPGPNGETATYNAPPTFDPARTGAYDSNEADNNDFAVTIGPSLPGYEILGELGRGGMGVVYKARQIALNRVVAIKMILAGPHASKETTARFLAEAQAVARFQHQNLVQVFEVGEFDGMPYFSLEFVDGGTLAKKIAREPQPPKYAAETVEQLARAMQYAHDRGIAHRDLKPANILIAPDGIPKITDFGLAKSLEDDSGQTQSGQIMGTPSYMAPEQAEGRPNIGAPADVYALGSILYDLLTGRPPFAGSSVLDTLEMVRTREPVPPSQLTAKLPRDLETICLKALQKDIAKRYASAGELADDLRRFLDGRPILARPVGKVEKAWRWAKREPAQAGALVLGLALLVVLMIASPLLYVAKVEASEARQKAENALASEKQAVIDKENARAAAVDAKNQAEANRQTAIKNGEMFVKQRDGVILAIRDVLRDVDSLMKGNTKFVPVRLAILKKMLDRLEMIRPPEENSTLDKRTEAIAYSRIGSVFFEGNRIDKAEPWLRKTYTLLKSLADEKPDDPAAVFNLSSISHQLADLEWRLGHGTRARELHADAVKARFKHVVLIESLVKQGKATEANLQNARLNLADSYGLLAGTDLRLGNPDSAITNYLASDVGFAALRTAASLPVRMRRAEIQVRLGDALLHLRKPDEAEKHYRAAVAEHETLLKLTPAKTGLHPTLNTNIAQARMYLGDFLLMARKDTAAAEKEYETSLKLFNDVLKLVPDNIDLQRRVAQMRSGFARIGGIFSAKDHFMESFQIRNALAKIDPTDTQQKVELMLILGRLGRATEAEKLAAVLLKIKDMDQQVRFQVVCGLAVAGGGANDEILAKRCRDKAFEVLAELVRDWKARGQLEFDPDLEALRDDPRFPALVSK
jgi:serine/threonine-protein kinase